MQNREGKRECVRERERERKRERKRERERERERRERERKRKKNREKTKIVLNTQTLTHHTYTDANKKSYFFLPGYNPTRLPHTLDNGVAGSRPHHAKAVDARVKEQIVV